LSAGVNLSPGDKVIGIWQLRRRRRCIGGTGLILLLKSSRRWLLHYVICDDPVSVFDGIGRCVRFSSLRALLFAIFLQNLQIIHHLSMSPYAIWQAFNAVRGTPPLPS
jgi:hypothetical protein